MKLFKGIIVSAMAIVMLIPSFAFADDGPFIKDLSKLRAKPYEWQFYDENGKAIDKRVILADVNKPVDKVDSVKPVTENKASQNVNNVVKRPAVANTNAPKTSDSSNIALYSMLLIGSVGAVSVIFRRKLRTNK